MPRKTWRAALAAYASPSTLVLLLLGRPAAKGDTVTWNNVRIEVTATAGRGVADANITRTLSPGS